MTHQLQCLRYDLKDAKLMYAGVVVVIVGDNKV